MPKLKTHKGAAKRFKVTASGKVKRNQAFTSHILTKKTRKRKRNLRKSVIASTADMRRLGEMLPMRGVR